MQCMTSWPECEQDVGAELRFISIRSSHDAWAQGASWTILSALHFTHTHTRTVLSTRYSEHLHLRALYLSFIHCIACPRGAFEPFWPASVYCPTGQAPVVEALRRWHGGRGASPRIPGLECKRPPNCPSGNNDLDPKVQETSSIHELLTVSKFQAARIPFDS